MPAGMTIPLGNDSEGCEEYRFDEDCFSIKFDGLEQEIK